MTLFEKMKAELLAARKDNNHIAKTVLAVAVGEIENKSKSANTEISNNNVIAVARDLINANNAIIDATESDDMKAKLQSENNVLASYVPSQLTDSELVAIIGLIKVEALKGGEKNVIGYVMKKLREDYFGRYDGKKASSFLRG